MNTKPKNNGRFGKKGIIIISAVIFAICIGAFFILSAKDEEAIKIGAIIPLSGPASQHKVFADAMSLAVEEVNQSGGLNGRKLELIIEDSKTEPEEGKKAFLKIEKQHHPQLYISTTSIVSLALAPLAEQTQVVLTGLAVANPTLTKMKKWVFKYYVTAEHEARPILGILKKLNVKKLCILFQNDAFGSSHHEVLKTAFEQTGGIVISEPFKAKSPEFSAKTPRLKDAEAVYIAGFVKVVGRAIKQLREDEYKGVILSHSGATSLPRSMPWLNDVYVAAPIIYNPNYVFAREAKERYEARYGSLFTHQAANGYDFIKILAGLLDGQDVSRENVRRLLEGEFSYPGIFGYIEKKSGEHDIHFPLYPARIVKGEIHYIQ